MAGGVLRSGTPLWLSQLEGRLQLLRENRCLGHEEGQGAECLHCNDCPGLDPHFWRKSCKKCKCRTEEHDIKNDSAKFEVLLYKPPKNPELEPGLEAGTLQPIVSWDTDRATVLRVVDPDGSKDPKLIMFDWVPENISNSMVIEFMNQLDSNSIPISGTQGATRRKTQLKVQIPSDDFDLSVRDNLSPEKKLEFDSYLVTARAAFGQGRVIRFSVGGLRVAKIAERNVEVNVDPQTIPVLLQKDTRGSKNWADEKWKENMTGDEVLNDMGKNEQGQLIQAILLEEDRDEGVKPEELVEDYNPLVEYKLFLNRVAEINNCTDEDAIPLKVITCDLDANLAESSVMYNELVKCSECLNFIKHKSVAVATQTQHGALALLWHPKCFVCRICGVTLADLYYFFADNRVFCGRHFVFWKSNWNRCGGCDKLILSGDYTFAEDMCFHVEHFCCKQCDLVLADRDYLMQEGHPFCIDCFSLNNCKKCKKCRMIIKVDQQGIHMAQFGDAGYWHATPICFRCEFCLKSLVGQPVMFRLNCPFCSTKCANSYLQTGLPKLLN